SAVSEAGACIAHSSERAPARCPRCRGGPPRKPRPREGRQHLPRQGRAPRGGGGARRARHAPRRVPRLTFRVGTSGYNYAEWKGTFYPADLPASKRLAWYVERFAPVEIHVTIYRMRIERKLDALWATVTACVRTVYTYNV